MRPVLQCSVAAAVVAAATAVGVATAGTVESYPTANLGGALRTNLTLVTQVSGLKPTTTKFQVTFGDCFYGPGYFSVYLSAEQTVPLPMGSTANGSWVMRPGRGNAKVLRGGIDTKKLTGPEQTSTLAEYQATTNSFLFAEAESAPRRIGSNLTIGRARGTFVSNFNSKLNVQSVTSKFQVDGVVAFGDFAERKAKAKFALRTVKAPPLEM